MANILHSASTSKGIRMDASVRQLRRAFERHQVRALPVVDRQQHVLGMVSHCDLAKILHGRSLRRCDAVDEDTQVSEIMSRQVLTLEEVDSPEAALRAMVAHRMHAVPVTRHGQLVGIITSGDFLREFVVGQWAGHQERACERMTSPGQTVEAADPLGRAWEVADLAGQEYVVVVRRHRPLGVLSRTSMLQFLSAARSEQKAQQLNATAVRLLLPSLPTVVGDLPLRNAAARMLESAARVLPVVDRGRMLIGLLHDDDILRAIVDALDANS